MAERTAWDNYCTFRYQSFATGARMDDAISELEDNFDKWTKNEIAEKLFAFKIYKIIEYLKIIKKNFLDDLEFAEKYIEGWKEYDGPKQ